MPNWLGLTDVPLMVSHRTLRDRKSFPRALGPWVLDSGGFTELNLHGEWTIGPDEYVAAVGRYADEIGQLTWAAPQDWMCEPFVLARTGLDVATHQRRTADNFCELDGRGPFIPVLQGWTRDDYLRHVDMYDQAGVDLTEREIVGLGSVCRRANESTIVDLVAELSGLGIALHGFGVKRRALQKGGYLFASADSMAWSYGARRSVPLAGCAHKSCANCLRFALEWRAGTLRKMEIQQPMLTFAPTETDLEAWEQLTEDDWAWYRIHAAHDFPAERGDVHREERT